MGFPRLWQHTVILWLSGSQGRVWGISHASLSWSKKKPGGNHVCGSTVFPGHMWYLPWVKGLEARCRQHRSFGLRTSGSKLVKSWNLGYFYLRLYFKENTFNLTLDVFCWVLSALPVFCILEGTWNPCLVPRACSKCAMGTEMVSTNSELMHNK